MRSPAGLVAVALAVVVLGDVSAVAVHRDAPKRHTHVTLPAPVVTTASPAPRSAPRAAPRARPKPPPKPKPWRLLFSVTGPSALGTGAPPGKASAYTVLPNGTDKLARPSASLLPLTQVNQVDGITVTTKVLSVSSTSFPVGPYCNADYCPESSSTSTEQGLVFQRLRTGAHHVVTKGGYDDTPVWSPDGRFVAYDRLTTKGHVVGIVDVQGRDRGVFATPPAGSQDTDPAWAPNNAAVAAVRTNAAGLSSIVVLHFDGSPRRVLTSGRGISGLAWSPDGKTVAFLEQHIVTGQIALGTDLWTVDVATGRVHQITHETLSRSDGPTITWCGLASNVPPLSVITPVFSPDGRFLAFASSYGHRSHLGNEDDVKVYDLRSGRVTTSFVTPDSTCEHDGAFLQPSTRQTALLGWVR